MQSISIPAALTILSGIYDAEDAIKIERLQEAGLAWDVATRLIWLAPFAMSRPMLESFGLRPNDFAIVFEDEDIQIISLNGQPEYAAILLLARHYLKHGPNENLSHETYKTIAESCVHVHNLSDAFKQGAEVEGASLETQFFDQDFAKAVIRPANS